MALSAVALVMVLMLGFIQLASHVTTGQSRRVQRKRAFYIAEAGLSEGMTAVREGRSGQVGSKVEPAVFGDGLFWVDAVQDPANDQVSLTSRGMVAGGDVSLSLVAQRGETSVASLGLFSGAALDLPAGSIVDSFDSAKGPYDPMASMAGARVGSQAAITVNGNLGTLTLIKGNITSGPGAPPLLGPGVEVSGSVTAASGVAPLPPIQVPSFVAQAGISHSSPRPLVISSGTGALESLALAANTQAVMIGPLSIVLGDLTVAPGAELVFDNTAGRIELFVTGNLVLSEGCAVTTLSEDSSQLAVLAASGATGIADLMAASQFHGVIYAPEAQTTVGSSFVVFGALVANQVSFLGPAVLHFDEHLVDIDRETSLPTLTSWRILSLGSDSANLNQNPFQILGVDKSTLKSPAESREDQILTIRYIDIPGMERTYSGPESGFDWSQVKSVVEGTYDDEDISDEGPRVAELAPSEVEATLLALIADPQQSSKKIRKSVTKQSPVSSAVLLACLDRSPSIQGSQLKKILVANSPLPADVLARVNAGTSGLSPKETNELLKVQ